MVQMDTVSTNNILEILRGKQLILVISFLQLCHPVPSINLASSAVKEFYIYVVRWQELYYTQESPLILHQCLICH